MYTLRYFLLVGFVLLCFSGKVAAQNVEFNAKNFPNAGNEFSSVLQDLDTGNILFGNGLAYCKYNLEYQYCNKGNRFYKEALPYFQRANQFNRNNADLNLKIGISYFFSPLKYKALPYFESAYSLNHTVCDLIDYYLAASYHLNSQWDSAIVHYSLAIAQIKNKPEIKHITERDLMQRIEQCKNGKVRSSLPIADVTIENAGVAINTDYPEYGAITLGDGNMMLFTSRRDSVYAEENSGNDDIEVDDILKNPESIYLSYKSQGSWLQSRKIRYPINKSNEHDAILSVAPDGKSILIYKRGDIFESLFIEGKWTDPDAIEGELNTTSQETSAIYSPDMKTIFFTSDRPESIGGKDIFIGTLNSNGICTQITNPGKNINTPYNEDGLFLTESGDELYFSSEGHNSVGGYDVFVTRRIDSVNWSEPINLGSPINSPGDDVFLVLNSDKKTGFYTSYRADGFGEKDIYMVSYKDPLNLFASNSFVAPSILEEKKDVIPEKIDTVVLYKKQNQLIIHGTIHDVDTKQKLNAMVRIVEKNIKDTIREIMVENGEYSVSLYDSSFYKFIVVASGYITKEEVIKIPADIKSFDISHFLVKDPSFAVRVDTVSEIFVESLGKDNSIIEGRIFDFLTNDNVEAIVKIIDIKTDSVVKVVRSEAKTGKFKVVVPSGKEYKIVADANGYLFQSNRVSTWASKPYTMYEDRVFRTNEAILKSNLDTVFSTVKYAGIAYLQGVLIDSAKKMPIKARITVTKLPSSEKIAIIESDNIGHYKIEIPTACKYLVEIESEGYIPIKKEMDVPVAAKIIDIVAQMKQMPSNEKMIKLNDLNYETGQFALSNMQKSKLNAIQGLLPSMSVAYIVITGYTDDRGSTELNLNLSKNRAEEVARYLQQNGSYNNVKIEVVGQGEQDPIAPNSSDDGRALNRRTEIVVRQIY